MELNEYIQIVKSEIIPQDEDVAREILKRYIERTREHVRSVNEYAKKACEVLKGYDWCFILKANALMHDQDKLNDGVFIAHYAPYVVKKYALDGLKDRFDVTENYKKQWNDYYVVQHCKKNGHHPEGWDKIHLYCGSRSQKCLILLYRYDSKRYRYCCWRSCIND